MLGVNVLNFSLILESALESALAAPVGRQKVRIGASDPVNWSTVESARLLDLIRSPKFKLLKIQLPFSRMFVLNATKFNPLRELFSHPDFQETCERPTRRNLKQTSLNISKSSRFIRSFQLKSSKTKRFKFLDENDEWLGRESSIKSN